MATFLSRGADITINVAEGKRDIHPVEQAAIALRANNQRAERLRGYLVQAVADAHSEGTGVTDLAKMAGVSRETIYQWLKEVTPKEED